MSRQERIENVLSEEYGTSELVSLVDSINGYNGDLEDQVWQTMDIWEISQYLDESIDLEHLLIAAADGDFDPRHDYYRWDSYGDIVSTDYPDFNLEEIAEWLDDHYDNLANCIGEGFASDFEDCDDEDDSLEHVDWPDDPTDYDGEDDEDDEDEGLGESVVENESASPSPDVVLPTVAMRLFRERVVGADSWNESSVARAVNSTQLHYAIRNGGRYAETVEQFEQALRDYSWSLN